MSEDVKAAIAKREAAKADARAPKKPAKAESQKDDSGS